jgi:subtilase family serine protease
MARRLSFLAVTVGVLFPVWAHAAQKPDARDRVRPNFDIRLQTPRVAPALDADAQKLLEELQRDHPGLRTRPHGNAAGLRTITADGRPLTPAANGTPEQIARRFLARYHHLLGLEGSDLASLVRTREYRSRGESVTHVVFDQSVDGLSVFGGRMQFQIAANGAILGVAHTTIPVTALPSAIVTSDDAVRAAINDIRPDLFFGPEAVTGPAGKERLTRFGRGPFKSDIEARLVVFPTALGARLAWQVVLEPPGLPQKYEVLIDAVTRELLYRRNRVLYADGVGRVLQSDAAAAINAKLLSPYPVGAGAPPFGCPPPANHLTRNLTTLFRDPATVLSATGLLQGNNVHVFRGAPDVEGAQGIVQPDGWHFEFSFNTAGAAETNLFFLSNFLHDFFYDLGFDEAAGNFQESNFGRGGVEGDSLAAVARASGRNNATFEPNPDGQRSIMSMFLWDATGCWAQDVDGDGTLDLDGDFDTDIAIHEFHHGVSNRLNTQWTGIEADAMGEGGSDFFAYSINNDTTLAEFAYPPSGIRSINGKTYGDFYCIDIPIFQILICEPHDNGEIFADVLWDLRERFRADNVGGSNAAAINMSHQLYVDGLKLSPPSPTMLDLRDAILTADGIRNPSGDPGGSRNHCRIWEAFATRGMGTAAQDTDDTGSASVVEDFTVAPECPALPAPATVTVSTPTATATEAGLQAGKFRLARTGDTSKGLTVYFTVSGSATPGSDYVALPASAQFAVGAATVDLAVTPLDDSLVESSETVVLTLTGSVGYLPGAPSAATVTIASDDVAPDLVVSALTAPTTGGAGAAITVSATTKNQGSGSAAASNTRYYLSTNTAVDAVDIQLGTSPIGTLAPAASVVSSATLTIPAGTATGIYYVLAQADGDAVLTETSETNNVRAVQIRIGPDLSVSPFTVPAVAAAGGTISVADTTKNTGGGAAGASVTRFYFSANTTYEASDPLIGSRNVLALGVGATSMGPSDVVIPASATAGSYYILARADGADAVAETIETNNTTAALVRIGPDLNVSPFTVPGVAAPGSTISVSDTTKNLGGGAAGASVTQFYFSVNTTYEAGDTLIGSRTVGTLAAGASSAGTANVVIPASATTGSYYIVARADGANAIAETIETNNTAAALVRIGPDLSLTGLGVTGPLGAGATITVKDTTKNTGGGASGTSVTQFYLSANNTVDATDTLLGSRNVPALAAGTSSAGSTNVTIPAGTPTGGYYILVLADSLSTVAETNETNNTGAMIVRIGPDMTISSFFGAVPLGSGGSITITETTKNVGGGSAGASTTRYYFSPNNTLDSSDTVIGSRSVPALATGATNTQTSTLTIPSGLATGTYYLIAQSDADNAVVETYETNNVAYMTLYVGPDLVVSSLSVPQTASAGASFSVSDTTRNQGGGSAPPSSTRLYLSTNSTFDAADVLLGSRSVGALAANGTASGTTTVVMPAGTPAATYYIIAVCDGDGSVAETNDTNNMKLASMTVSVP